MSSVIRAAPDLVGAFGSDDFGGSTKIMLKLDFVADRANAPSEGRSGAARLEAGREGRKYA